MNKTISPKITALTFGILAIVFLAAFYVMAWQEPSQAPPGGNVPAPLNIGSTGQSKAGGLILNTGGAANGLIVDKGNLCIGIDCRSSWPAAGGLYRMAECSASGGGGGTISCTASCPSGYTIVSSCKSSALTAYEQGDHASGQAALNCNMATPGPCSGSSCSASLGTPECRTGSTACLGALKVSLLCEK